MKQSRKNKINSLLNNKIQIEKIISLKSSSLNGEDFFIVNSFGALYSLLERGVGELTDHYDKEVDKYMGMPQKEMERYPEYIQAKREGKSEEQARFRAADPRSKRGALMSLFTGVIKGMMKYGVNHLTGSAADGIVTRYVQDFLGGRGVDGVFEKGKEIFEK